MLILCDPISRVIMLTRYLVVARLRECSLQCHIFPTYCSVCDMFFFKKIFFSVLRMYLLTLAGRKEKGRDGRLFYQGKQQKECNFLIPLRLGALMASFLPFPSLSELTKTPSFSSYAISIIFLHINPSVFRYSALSFIIG